MGDWLKKMRDAASSELVGGYVWDEEAAKLVLGVVEASRRCYPTLHSHMIHCLIRSDHACTCGKADSDRLLGVALSALQKHVEGM